MKEYNINYEGLSFEEKVKLKLSYYYSLPRTREIESGILNLAWVLSICNQKDFIEKVSLKKEYYMNLPKTLPEVENAIVNLMWVENIYYEDIKKKVRAR